MPRRTDISEPADAPAGARRAVGFRPMNSTGSRHGRPDASQTIAQTAPRPENPRPRPGAMSAHRGGTCRAAARHVVPPRMVQWVAPRARGAENGGGARERYTGRRSRSRGAARTPGRRRRRQPCSEPDTLPSGSDTEDGEGTPGSPTAGVSSGRTGETAVGTQRACHSGDGPASRTERVARREGIAMRRLATALCILVVAAWSFPAAAAAEQARGRQRGARPAQAERAPRRAPQRAAPARSAPPRRMSQPRGRASAGRAAAQAPARQGAVRRAAPRTSGSSRATAPATRSAGRPSPRQAAGRAAAQAPARQGAARRAAPRTSGPTRATPRRQRDRPDGRARNGLRGAASGGRPPARPPGPFPSAPLPAVVPPRPPPGGTAGAPRRCGAHPNAASGAPRRLRPVAIEP